MDLGKGRVRGRQRRRVRVRVWWGRRLEEAVYIQQTSQLVSKLL